MTSRRHKKEDILISSKSLSLIGFKKVAYVDSIGDSKFQATLLDIVREYEVSRIFAHFEDEFKLVDSLRKFLNLIDKHLPGLYRFKSKLQMKRLLKDLDVPYEVSRIFAHFEDEFKLVDSLRKFLNLIDKHLPGLYRFKSKLQMKRLLKDLDMPYEVSRIFAHFEDEFKLVDSLRKFLNLIDKHLPGLYRFKSKLQMKRLLKDLDVPMASHIKAENVIDIHGYVESNGGYPLVIKPIDGSGSVGVSILRTDEDLSKWYQAPHDFPDSSCLVIM